MDFSKNHGVESHTGFPSNSPPAEPRTTLLEIVAMVIGGGVFVVAPAVWIIYVMLKHFNILPQ